MLRCQGDAQFTGGTEVEGQDGGDGGDAVNDQNDDSDEATGGDGDDGGTLKVQSTGDIDFSGANGGTTLHLADGGHGGNATRIAQAPGASATATGGKGGDAGDFEVRALGGITISPGGLTIIVGRAGDGGSATAVGADGMDAGAQAAQDGGSATATGGMGGSSPEGRLRASGNVSGLANITVSGGDGGDGGDASATAGSGGDGNEDFKDGADGGDMSATGGKGGDSQTRDQFGNLFGLGGNGGEASLAGGMGGWGWDDCIEEPYVPGGNGGMGGSGSGSGGAPGTGLANGIHGDIAVAATTGDGGFGGDGDGPGGLGNGGDDSGIDPKGGARLDGGANFEDGRDGLPCETLIIEAPPIEFEHVVGETECLQVIGTYTLTNNTDEPMTYAIASDSPLISFREDGGNDTFDGGITGTIPPESTVTIIVYFNCQDDQSFNADIAIEVTQNDEVIGTEETTIFGDVYYPPQE